MSHTHTHTHTQVTASADQTLKLWDMSAHKVVTVMMYHNASVKTVSVSPVESSKTTFSLCCLMTSDTECCLYRCYGIRRTRWTTKFVGSTIQPEGMW